MTPCHHRSSIAQALGLRLVCKNVCGGDALSRLNIQKVNSHAALSVHAVYIVFQLLNLTGHQQAVLLLCNCCNLKNGRDLPGIYCNQVASLDRCVRLINLYGTVVNKLRNDTRIENKNVFLEVEFAVVVAVHLGALSCGQAIRQDGILFCRRYLLIRAEISTGKGNPSPLHRNLRSRRIGALGLVRKTDTALALEAHQEHRSFRSEVSSGSCIRFKRCSFGHRNQAVGGRNHDVIIIGAVCGDVAVVIVWVLRLIHRERQGIDHCGYPGSTAKLCRCVISLFLNFFDCVEEYNGTVVVIADQASVVLHVFRGDCNSGLPAAAFQLFVSCLGSHQPGILEYRVFWGI